MVVTISTAQWLTWVINFVLPAIVAFVTARNATPGVKAVVLAVLSILTGVIVSYVHALNAGLPFDWQNTLLTIVSGYVVAIVTHTGFLKPLAVTGSDGKIQLALPGGLGDSKL